MTKYNPHIVKCFVNIGDEEDSDIRADYCRCIQGSKSLIIIKYNTACAIYDFKAFMNKDYSKPLNAKKFKSTEEAYKKMMMWIGKMVKKDGRGRYYNNSQGPYHFESVLEDSVLDSVRKKVILDRVKNRLKG